jgi:hypothetical protein
MIGVLPVWLSQGVWELVELLLVADQAHSCGRHKHVGCPSRSTAAKRKKVLHVHENHENFQREIREIRPDGREVCARSFPARDSNLTLRTNVSAAAAETHIFLAVVRFKYSTQMQTAFMTSLG